MMKVGMLWFDDNLEMGIAQRIGKAAEYYQSKYGQRPNLCIVHPEIIGDELQLKDLPLKVESSQRLLHNHFWIGIAEESE